MANIAPGVYTSIIPLEQYTTSVTGTNGFICFFSDKGPDNQLTYIGSGGNNSLSSQVVQSFIQVYGQPNLSKYTSAFGLGPYVAQSYSSVSNSLYCLRVLPPDATYSNTAFYLAKTTNGQLVTIQQNISNIEALTSLNGTMFYSSNPSSLGLSASNFEYFMPLFTITSKYRGEFYNNMQVQVYPIANNDDEFEFQVYQKFSDNNYYILSSYDTSFNPNLLDNSGVSTLISSVVDSYDQNVSVNLVTDNPITGANNELIADTVISNTNYINGDIIVNNATMFNVIEVVDVVNSVTQIPTNFQNGTSKYFVTNNAGNSLYGYSGSVVTVTQTLQNGLPVYTVTPVTYVGSNGTSGTAGQVYTTSGITSTTIIPEGTIIVDSTTNVIYFHLGYGELQVFDPYTYSLMVSANTQSVSLNNTITLSQGSDGSLITSTGVINSTVANQYLQQAYMGLVDPNVLNTAAYPFDLVFDAGYPLAVKQSIVTLTSELRQDCMSLIDLGMNSSYTSAIQNRIQNENFNTFYNAIYDPYVNIADPYSGRNIWMTPIYVVSQLFALSDEINDVWYAVAGYNRGAVNNINSLLYQPDLDTYYTNQINPILNTPNGNVIWGQLTSQSASNAMQNINVVRLVLYVERAIKNLGQYYIFDMNDAITWANIQTSIENFLATIASARGLQSYSVSVSATQYQMNNKQVTVTVNLTPTRALEQIIVPIYVS